MSKTRNKMQLTFFLLMIFIVVGCTTETKKEKVTESTELAEQTPKLIKEDFATFFEQFSIDSVFQLSRINFPISYYTVDIEDNKEEYVYTRDEFWYIDFSKDNKASSRKTDAYEPVIQKKEDSKTTYIRMGIDNGIRVEYYFEMDDKGKWYMIKVIDNSN